MTLAAVVLAAGQGTRMKSNLPKVLHPVAGIPMVQYALAAAHDLGSERTILVVGHGADRVRQVVGEGVEYCEQSEPRGTGHAVLQARSALRGKADTIVVTYADMPLLETATLTSLAARHAASHAALSMLTVQSSDTMGFGRIVRDANGQVLAIVEESQATPEQLAIRELNCGVYCFDATWMWPRLDLLKPNGKKQEYYLTDLVAMAVNEGARIESITLHDVSQVVGINTRAHLAAAEKIMRERINGRLMESGVTLIDPATTYIEANVEIGMDTVVEPGTHLQGHTRIGANCRIGPQAMIANADIGDDCQIVASVIRESTLADHVHVGPYADLRPGCFLARKVYVGNHAEIKNSRLGEGVHVGHFSYVGDSDIGARTNIGAGTVTCNFDGKRKHRTIVGEDAFIGCDSMLRAPITIGDRAATGAGSVVTKDVPADSLAVGTPARVIKRLR